jgi:hypothetical protein
MNNCLLTVALVTMPELMWLITGFPLWWLAFEPRSGHVGFVVDNVALRQVFSKYFSFRYKAFHQLCHTHHYSSSKTGINKPLTSVIVDSVPLLPKKQNKNCCTLSFSVSYYSLFTDATVTLPAPAYVLCAGYFFVFILSALLLHGLTVVSQYFVLTLWHIPSY